ncbi:carboxypeptidase [Histoplasma capsulatum G186AR]|uniref:Carboxypeptidase n=1 Tax=Ajellomyces capsulatus (strain G186AR / H82 / ATCC MYA-2454 / RMSCC 2432) TaxID=447093 RepID=C0NKN1_AJECG|nr:carboxypeptidase [Histoplasma capsulatum G186AR]EEH08422.1 carboxypeptidase [Histoplasma capsulatum G186AR]
MTSHSWSQQVIQERETKLYSPIRDALLAASIIPDVLDDFTPTFPLLISYPSTHTTVSLGSYLSPDAVRSQPVFEFHPFPFTPDPDPSPSPARAPQPDHPTKFYSIVLTDPDAKSRKHPIWSEMCHWVVSNISSPGYSSLQGHIGRNSDSFTGTTLSYTLTAQILKSYLPPSPLICTGYHRYVFVLLEGDAATACNVSAPRERKHWGYGGVRLGVRNWAKEYGLEAVGATFFYAKAAEGE